MKNDLTAKERMKIPRQPMPEQPPEIRRANFKEVPNAKILNACWDVR